MHGSTRHFPSSCVDNEFHNGAAEIPMPSWCQGMKTKGQYTKDGETQKDKEWVLNDTEGQLHQQYLPLSPVNIFLCEIFMSFRQKHHLVK